MTFLVLGFGSIGLLVYGLLQKESWANVGMYFACLVAAWFWTIIAYGEGFERGYTAGWRAGREEGLAAGRRSAVERILEHLKEKLAGRQD